MPKERVQPARRERESLTPAFRAFLREVEAALGKTRRVTAHDVEMWAVAAPKLETVGRWAKAARTVGGAATSYVAGGEPELRVVFGKVSRLSSLLSAKLYEPGQVTQALRKRVWSRLAARRASGR